MSAQNMLVVADAHLHWYPSFVLKTALESASSNLGKLADGNNPRGLPVLKLGFMVEGSGLRFFEQLRDGEVDCASLGIEISVSPDGRCLLLERDGACLLSLIAGRQIVTSERLEVLGIGLSSQIDDGAPLREAIRSVLTGGGFPILPWSPGKWLFNRGRLIKEVIESSSPERLALGDSALRPRGLSEPSLLRLARKLGFAVLPGSDPLPLSGEERGMGSYGFLYKGWIDPDNLFSSVLSAFKQGASSIRPAGIRHSPCGVISRLLRLSARKRKEMAARKAEPLSERRS